MSTSHVNGDFLPHQNMQSQTEIRRANMEKTIDTVVSAIDLTKIYGDKVALSRVNLDVKKGEVIGLLGPNGAGKTTLLEILEGLQKPESGQVSLFGKAPADLTPDERGRIGIVFQRYALPSHFSVWQLCDLYHSMYPQEREEKILMQQLGLNHLLQQQIGDLSAGQRQRLSIFAALYGNKSLVVLDEPTSALDVRSRRAVWDVLLAKKKSGVFSGIIATHHMEEAMELCDRIYFIDGGEIKMQGNVRELIAQHSDKMSIKFTANESFVNAISSLKTGNLNVIKNGMQHEIECAASQAGALISEILLIEQQQGTRANLLLRQPSLEDVYLKIIAD